MRWMLGLALAIGAATPAAAQITVGPLTVTGQGSVTSDYRFRGVSQTNGDPALQAYVRVDHDSGFHVAGFASTLSDDLRPGVIEARIDAGYTHQLNLATNLDVGVQLYTYPDNGALTGATYVEPYAALSHTLGPVTAEVGAAYAPEQDAIGGQDSLYVYGDVSSGLIILPINVTGRLGYTSGQPRFVNASDYWDWRVGAEYKLGIATFALEYVDTDLVSTPNADPTLVASLKIGF